MIAQKNCHLLLLWHESCAGFAWKDSHELSCGSCGAPLHDLKRLPVEPRAKTPKKKKGSVS